MYEELVASVFLSGQDDVGTVPPTITASSKSQPITNMSALSSYTCSHHSITGSLPATLMMFTTKFNLW
jgi:hypothetical protein